MRLEGVVPEVAIDAGAVENNKCLPVIIWAVETNLNPTLCLTISRIQMKKNMDFIQMKARYSKWTAGGFIGVQLVRLRSREVYAVQTAAVNILW